MVIVIVTASLAGASFEFYSNSYYFFQYTKLEQEVLNVIL